MKEEQTIAMKEPEFIKIYGLQRSGTNWLTFLLNENFRDVNVLVNEGGWKHGHYYAPWILKKEVHVVSIIKNPYSWLVSVYNYWGPKREKNIGPDLQGVEFSDFIRNRYIGEKQKGLPFLMRAKNPVQHWNNMNIHWLSLSLKQKKSCFVTYETLIESLAPSLEMLCQNLGLKKLHENQWINQEKTFVPSSKAWKVGEKNFDIDYYRNQAWMSMYTPELIEFVNNEIDLDLMAQFGYMPLSPEEACHQ